MDKNAWYNAKQLYHAISYVPKERVTNQQSEYMEPNKRKCGKWNYTFAAADLKSASLLYGFCNREGLRFSMKCRGILVREITNEQINHGRKICNKASKRFPINL